MFRSVIAFPLLALVVIMQSTIVSRITLLSGHADLVLVVLAAWALRSETTAAWLWATVGCVMVSIVSKMPWPIVFTKYMFVVFIAQLLSHRIWQAPMLAIFSVTLLGSITMDALALLVLNLLGSTLPLVDAFGLIILPSALLNLLFAVPIYIIIRDLTQRGYVTQEIE